ncbi:MAG: hypothetical protein H7263_09745 [Candidatus Sericytochromatia bacterium]|nr:hypothetical protein [Candidatus Sericytochromatia bacterium]
MIKNLRTLLFLAGFTATVLSACGPTAPPAQAPTGGNLESDSKIIQGKVTGTKVGAKTMVALSGSFLNLGGNKIDAQNNTITEDQVLATAPVVDGKYNFSLPKAPSKANTAANLKMFVFNDDNGNKTFDANETKSKDAQIRYVVGFGYQSGRDSEGNEVLFSEFKDFNFTLD